MRLLVYNIRYGTGGNPSLPTSGYLKKTSANLDKITKFIKELAPDIVGLLEVDAGSYRANGRNQAEHIASELGHYHTYGSKYAKHGLARFLPLINKQGNAFLTSDDIKNQEFHYFEKGFKRLVIELETENLIVFLVHLSLSFRVRHHQMSHLYELVRKTKRPHIVAGDFNAFWGDKEIQMFLAATGLTNANDQNRPSFPSWSPKRQLDFILHSPEIEVTGFSLPEVSHSDHLPLVCDFNITAPN